MGKISETFRKMPKRAHQIVPILILRLSRRFECSSEGRLNSPVRDLPDYIWNWSR
jgi:hypothetical protein